jgi:CRISPR-associated protein Cas5h
LSSERESFPKTTDTVIVFDIWSDYAHYRKIETTTSPLTYSIPTGTAIMGMIAAIIGFERDSYYDELAPSRMKFAIRVLSNPPKKNRMNLTLLDTSKGVFLQDIGENPRTLIPYEFIQNPKFRIYVWLKDEGLQAKLKQFLKEHKSYYTPTLGTANMIANFSYENEYKLEKANEGLVHSIARMDNGHLEIESGKRYIIEKIPIHMNKNRIVQDYAEIVYEVTGKPVRMSNALCYKVGLDNIVFLQA